MISNPCQKARHFSLQNQPDYSFLTEKHGIHNLEQLKIATEEILTQVDLNTKKRDFEHLLFYKKNSERILAVGDFFRELKEPPTN
jgi:hypothetical protein